MNAISNALVGVYSYHVPMSEASTQLVMSAADTGLGELNALGFGFMNLKHTGGRPN